MTGARSRAGSRPDAGNAGRTGSPLDARLVGPAAACWASAGALVGSPEWLVVAVPALWLAAAAALTAVVLVRRRAATTVWAQVAVCCAAAAVAASAVSVAEGQRMPDVVTQAAGSHRDVVAILTVTSAPTTVRSFGGASARVRFTATLGSLSAVSAQPDPGSRGLSVPVLVYAAEPRTPDAARIGSTISLAGTLHATLPGSAAAAQLFARGAPRPVSAPPWWLAWAADLRDRFAAESAQLPGDGGALLPGLAIGDTRAVGAELDTAMKASSLSHLTAVSGANCVVVVASVMLFAAALRLPRGVRVTVALIALGGFVVLVTPEPSVLRAAFMAGIVLLGTAAGRPGRGLPTLCVAVLVLLVADPWMSRSFGFALSVLATAGLLVLSGPLTRTLGRWMPIPVAAALAIPLAAQLACQPVLVLLNPTLPLYGVPANLLAAPAAPAATLIGLAGCLLFPALPGVASALLHVAWVPAAWIAAVARAIAVMPGSRLPWWEGLAGAAIIAALTLLTLAVALRRAGRRGARWPAAATALVLVFTGAYSGSLAGAGISRLVTFPADWQLAACDIGQGDAVVVRDGDMHALVDVGPEPAALTRCLKTLGIDRIDLLVLTHYDLDHVGGLAAVLGRVDTALVGIPENAQDERLHRLLTANGADVRRAARGDRGTLGGLRWDILWPRRGTTAMQTGNDGSVTIRFAGRGICSLFLGDLGEESQRALQAASRPGAVDVVKVAHHGSADQSPELYATLRATVGLISVGADNGYGHPTKRLLDILRASGTAAFRTDRQGMLVVAPRPEAPGGVTLWTERSPPAATSQRTALSAPAGRLEATRKDACGHTNSRQVRGVTPRQGIRGDPPTQLEPGASGPGHPRLGHRVLPRGACHPSTA